MDDPVCTPESFDSKNDNHNPSLIPSKLKMRPGWLAIHFPAMPTQEGVRAGVVLPGRKERDPGKARAGMIDADHPPNCARVFAAGEGCKAAVGEYVMFHQRVEDGRDAHYLKPQPLIPIWDPMDRLPSLWALKDAHVIATLPHAGDSTTVEFEGIVEVLGLSGRWLAVSGEHLDTGERFRVLDDAGNVVGVYVATSRSTQISDEGVEPERWRISAAPYDGPEK